VSRPPERPLLFYANWGLGYFNVEARRKAEHFARSGFDTAYCAGLGIRNPSPRAIAELARRGAALVRRDGEVAAVAGLRTISPAVLPPRHAAALRRLNAGWLERQLVRDVAPWDEAVAWVRYPTPELVDVLERRPPRLVVYECVDAYDCTPGIVGRWVEIFADAERRLAGLAAAVVVPSPPLAERFTAWGADTRLIPHGVDLPGVARAGRAAGAAPVAGFVGTLDYRIDVPALRLLAGRHPDWRVRLVGAVQDGFDSGAFSDLPNVAVEGPVPHERLADVLAEFDLGLMPYVDAPVVRHMAPVKNLEYLAAGLPAVARPLPALRPFAGELYFAEDPEAFVAAAERAVAEDSPARADARRQLAREHGWDRRLGELVALVRELLGRDG
jgi:glycosyltransferase involved in cell wall biosynthesis